MLHNHEAPAAHPTQNPPFRGAALETLDSSAAPRGSGARSLRVAEAQHAEPAGAQEW